MSESAAVPETRRPAPLVLVVDDEPGIVDFLRYALEDHGYRVETAHDGRSALEQINHEVPEFVITDLMMPHIDGWELCRRLRRRSDTRTIHIIAMSAVDMRGVQADAFLRKPFELTELLNTLGRIG